MPVTAAWEKVSKERLWARLMAMAEVGRVGPTGVNRQALTGEDVQARRLLARWGRELGLQPFHDAIGNLFLRLEGTVANAQPLLVGSHLDSQPTGGRFDGVYGVLAGFEVPAEETTAFTEFLDALGYFHQAEGDNRAYRMFLGTTTQM